MHNTKVYSIIEHFDKYEQNRLRKYLSSPYFNKNETLVELYEVFIKYINSNDQSDWPKEKVWKKIMPKVGYDDVRFRKYLSDLLKLIEGFLAQQIYEENPLHHATYLIEAVGQKKMEKLYKSTMKNARRLSNSQPNRSSNFFFHQYQIEKCYYDLTEFESKRFDRTNVEEIARNLDIFYLAEKLRIYCQVINQQFLISEEYKLLFIEEILDHIDKINYEDIPAISLYHQIYLTSVENDNISHYYRLKSLLDRFAHNFSKKEALAIYYSAVNYCIRQINGGNQKFLEELFSLYQDLVEKEIIFINNELSPFDFKNIIVLALRLGHFDWTKSFIENYSQKIPENSRENAVTYNLAQLYFYQKSYDKVIEQLRNVEYEDVTYNLNSKSMLLATYYEMDEIEPLYSLMGSFRTYLNRHKDISEGKRKDFLNLIKYTRQLIKIPPGDQKAVKKLKEEVNNTKNLASPNWLKKKIAELED